MGKFGNYIRNIPALCKFILEMVDWNGSPKQDGNLSLIVGDLRSEISEMERRKPCFRKDTTVLSA
jgi:hypothetical protein